MASPGNRHCATCIGALSFAMRKVLSYLNLEDFSDLCLLAVWERAERRVCEYSEERRTLCMWHCPRAVQLNGDVVRRRVLDRRRVVEQMIS